MQAPVRAREVKSEKNMLSLFFEKCKVKKICFHSFSRSFFFILAIARPTHMVIRGYGNLNLFQSNPDANTQNAGSPWSKFRWTGIIFFWTLPVEALQALPEVLAPYSPWRLLYLRGWRHFVPCIRRLIPLASVCTAQPRLGPVPLSSVQLDNPPEQLLL